jgi:hypothetical protein
LREELLEEVESEEDAGDADDDGSIPTRTRCSRRRSPGRADGHRLDLDAAAPAAARLHRAGRLIDMLERRGIISGYEGSKPRQVLITEADVPRILSHLAEAAAAAGALAAARTSRPSRRPRRGAPRRPERSTVGGHERSRLRGRRPPSSAGARFRAGSLEAMEEIGATLREARMRARIDISEVEARTKIRAKYLRAIENEEWDLLPGPVYVKSFLRTYSDYLGLDSRMLIDDYRRRYERPSDHERGRSPRSAASASARSPRAAAAAVGR